MPPCRPRLLLRLLSVALVFGGAVAWADWEVGLGVDEGLSVLGGPLSYRMARPDAVTSASVDAVTSASRLAHGGGLQLQLRRGENLGSLVVGLEYVTYRFDLDYEVGRASVDVVGARLLVLARLVLVQLRGRPFFSFGFGSYLELSFYDKAELGGEWVNLSVAPAGVGLAVDFRLEPYRFEVAGRGRLVPALILRGYRGLITQLRDDLGSAAPLSSIMVGLGLRYELPSSQGRGRSGR